jgi:1-deoxy-D-xylulose-5-phosphate synthase
MCLEVGDTLLKKINSPEDLKRLSSEEMKKLAGEIRELIIKTTKVNGGHLASNLGAVELTLALHKVFESPKDKILWDVGHQAYTHKILTGRRELFGTLRKMGGISGFPRREESPHDITDPGHASTSISSGIGIKKGQDLSGKEGYVISVIGDGALTGGLALEAINFTGHIPNNLIIVLNDNSMSIDKNVGAISSYLSRIAAASSYVHFSQNFDKIVYHIPLIGKPFFRFYNSIKKGLKSIFYRDGLFTVLGFKYIGPIDGHNLPLLEKMFYRAKAVNRPVVIHIKTIKGRGSELAEGDPSSYHGVSPLPPSNSTEKKDGVKLTSAFSEVLMEEAENDSSLVAITAAMKEGTGLSAFQKKYPQRFFDVGIAEGHGVTFAAGLAIAGQRPVVAIYSTFMQRVVDQVIHDVAIPCLPVIFILDRAGIIPGDGETHQGLYDMALFRSVPGLDVLAPVTANEIKEAFRWAVQQKNPVMIRYSKMTSSEELSSYSEPFEKGKGVFLKKGESQSPLLFINLGGLANEILEASELLEKEGILSDVYNLRFATSLVQEALLSLVEPYELVVFVEEGVKQGGVGEHLASMILEEEIKVKFLNLSVPNGFPCAATRDELISSYGLDGLGISNSVLDKWQSYRFRKVVDQVKNDSWEAKKL